MYPFSIGVMLDSFRTDVNTALDKAQALGAKDPSLCYPGRHVSQRNDSRTPPGIPQGGKRSWHGHFRPLWGFRPRLCPSGKNPELIEESKRILDLAKDLETDVVTTHIGVVPEDPTHPRYGIMQEACGQLAAYADSLKAHFAIETGPEKAATLKGFWMACILRALQSIWTLQILSWSPGMTPFRPCTP